MSDSRHFPTLVRPPDQITNTSTAGSYADHVKTNIKWDQRLKRNVLEIILDNDKSEYADIPDDVTENLFRSIGIERDHFLGSKMVT